MSYFAWDSIEERIRLDLDSSELTLRQKFVVLSKLLAYLTCCIEEKETLTQTAPKHDYHCLCNKCVGIEPKKHACRACGGKGVFSKANVNVEATGGLKKDHE